MKNVYYQISLQVNRSLCVSIHKWFRVKKKEETHFFPDVKGRKKRYIIDILTKVRLLCAQFHYTRLESGPRIFTTHWNW